MTLIYATTGVLCGFTAGAVWSTNRWRRRVRLLWLAMADLAKRGGVTAEAIADLIERILGA
jgi:hypothetical protein